MKTYKKINIREFKNSKYGSRHNDSKNTSGNFEILEPLQVYFRNSQPCNHFSVLSVLFHVAPQSTVDATFKKAVPYIFITRGLNSPRHLLGNAKGSKKAHSNFTQSQRSGFLTPPDLQPSDP